MLVSAKRTSVEVDDNDEKAKESSRNSITKYMQLLLGSFLTLCLASQRAVISLKWVLGQGV